MPGAGRAGTRGAGDAGAGSSQENRAAGARKRRKTRCEVSKNTGKMGGKWAQNWDPGIEERPRRPPRPRTGPTGSGARVPRAGGGRERSRSRHRGCSRTGSTGCRGLRRERCRRPGTASGVGRSLGCSLGCPLGCPLGCRAPLPNPESVPSAPRAPQKAGFRGGGGRRFGGAWSPSPPSVGVDFGVNGAAAPLRGHPLQRDLRGDPGGLLGWRDPHGEGGGHGGGVPCR